MFSSRTSPGMSGNTAPPLDVRGLAQKSLNCEAGSKCPSTQPPETVTLKRTGRDSALASPLLSRAVTVMVAVPGATPLTVSIVPFTDTEATPVSLEFAIMRWLSS